MLLDREVVEELGLIRHEGELGLGRGPDTPRSCPAIRMVPEVGWMMPQSDRRVVVLPAPLGPTSPRTSPLRTSKVSDSTATTEP
jgi:hypothetical protein